MTPIRALLKAIGASLVLLAGIASAHGGYESETEVRIFPDRMRIVVRSSLPFAWKVLGDRFHLTDIDPDRPGLENYIIQQNNGSGLATALYHAGTGAMIKTWYAGGVVDVGRGVAGDFDPTVKGCEMFSTMAGLFDGKGNQLHYNHPFPPEAIWWDGDLVREFVSTIGSSATSPGIDKPGATSSSSP